MIGAGIVGIPFAYMTLGVPGALIINCIMIWQTLNSCRLYFLTMDMLSGLESLSEIGYRLLGRKSIFIINGMVMTNCVAYYNIFGGIMSQIFLEFTGNDDSFFTSDTFFKLLLFAINLPLVLSRTLKELKLASYILVTSVGVFILGFLLLFLSVETRMNPD